MATNDTKNKPGNPVKACTMCSEDLTSKPRTKDAKGRYFCPACYEKAVAKKRSRRSDEARSLAGGSAGPGFDLHDPEPNVLEHLLDLEPAHAPAALICPKCRSTIPPGGIICVTCGFNVQTHEQAGSVRVKTRREAGGRIWPAIVGVISMVLGGGSATIYGIYFILAFFASVQAGALGGALVTVLPIGSLFTALGLWLFRDGLRIFRHDSDGVKWIRYWAMAKIVLYGTCLGALLSIPPGPLEQGLTQMNSDLTVADVKSSILLVMAWLLFWPVFVMVFFFIPRIQEDVEAWG